MPTTMPNKVDRQDETEERRVDRQVEPLEKQLVMVSNAGW